MSINKGNLIELEKLTETAKKIRADIIRMTTAAGSGHPGPAFSIVEMVTVLFFSEMRMKVEDPDWEDRDRFVLSKGHAAPALYAALCEKGMYSQEEILKLRKIGSPLQGHPDAKMKGVEATSGSLGTGLSQAVGMAMGAKMLGKDIRVYAIIGDGECDEGQIWEAALSAAHFKLDNLYVFLDHNHDQAEGSIEKVMGLEPLKEKWLSFGWQTWEINGHDFQQIFGFLAQVKSQTGAPKIAIAETQKGYGVSFMAGKHEYHARALTSDETKKALSELE